MEQAVVNLKLPRELKDRAQKKAKTQGESLSSIIRHFLREWSEN